MEEQDYRRKIVKYFSPVSGQTTRIPNSIQYKAKHILADRDAIQTATFDGGWNLNQQGSCSYPMMQKSENSTKQWNGTK